MEARLAARALSLDGLMNASKGKQRGPRRKPKRSAGGRGAQEDVREKR